MNSEEISHLIFAGTYTGNSPDDSQGIYAFGFSEIAATLTPLGLVARTSNPSYILIDRKQKYLYAVSEEDQGRISAFEINSNDGGKLKFINQQSSRGSAPCYLSTDRAGRYLFVANYNDGTVAGFPLDQNDGHLKESTDFDRQIGSSVNPTRQQSSHAHSILLDLMEENLLSANLGSDEIYTYRFSSNNGSFSRLTVTKTARAGDGPRHMIFHSHQPYLYVINELQSTITVYHYSPHLHAIQTISTLPKGYQSENYPAEILLHPLHGNYLYASNRGHDSIVVYTVNIHTGRLSLIQHIHVQGRTPRNFIFSPDGAFLFVANQNSNNIVLFTVNSTTGKLTATNSTVEINKPTCLKYFSFQ